MLKSCLFYLVRTLSLVSLVVVSVNCSKASSLTPPPPSPEKIRALVAEYYDSKANSLLELKLNPSMLHPDDRCRPGERPLACIDAVCKHMSSYNCDDTSELRRAGQICANQNNGLCIDAVCSHMSSYNCDDFNELEQVGQICEGQYNNRCIDAVCSHMSSYNCDDISELKQVGAACTGFNDVGCINSVCSRLSSYNCDDINELKDVIKACKGQ